MTNINNSLTNQTVKPKFSVAIQSKMYQDLVNTTLGDKKRAMNFIASISSAVAINPALQECDAGTILSGALVGESLGLSPSPSLGHFFLVPYNDTKNNRKVATFQLGYVGMINLAQRSGMYHKIVVSEIKEGELKKFNKLTEEYEFELIEDDDVRDKTPTIGYFAYFELKSGMSKALYWTKAKMEKHATRYSQAYRNKFGSSFWLQDFDLMGKKTMLRQLISKWGVMSAEIQDAYRYDQAVINEGGKIEYVDNDNSDIKVEDKEDVEV